MFTDQKQGYLNLSKPYPTLDSQLEKLSFDDDNYYEERRYVGGDVAGGDDGRETGRNKDRTDR